MELICGDDDDDDDDIDGGKDESGEDRRGGVKFTGKGGDDALDGAHC